MKVQKGKKTGRKGLTCEDIKEIIIHIISMIFYYIYIYTYIHTHIYIQSISNLLNYISERFAQGRSRENKVSKVPKYAMDDRDPISGKSPRNDSGIRPSISSLPGPLSSDQSSRRMKMTTLHLVPRLCMHGGLHSIHCTTSRRSA